MCNANPIHIGDILQTKDSCVYVTFHYKGEGDVYVLNRVSKSNIPTARNIIHEGIYLGQYELYSCFTSSHNSEDVSTVLCRIFENASYTIYATVVDHDCIHTPVKKEFHTEGMLTVYLIISSLFPRNEVECV